MREGELLATIERAAHDVFHACASASADGDRRALHEARAAETVIRLAALLARLPRVTVGDLRILRGKLTSLAELVAAGERRSYAPLLEELLAELAATLLLDERDDELASIADAFERKVG